MVVDPAFSHDVFSLDDAICFFYLFIEKYDFQKKTLSVTHYLEKTVYGKPKSGTGVRLLIGNV